jgi:hypothetical protein
MRARFMLALVLLGALWSGQVVSPLPVLACSCAMPGTMAEYRGDSSHMVLMGRVASVAPTGVEVQVERWFQGPGGAMVSFAPDGFGDQSAACQDPWPTVGGRWIWVAWVPELGAHPQTNLCTPKAAMDSAEGDAMLAAIVTSFGTGTTVDPPDEPAPEPPPTPPARELVLVAIVAAVTLAPLALFVAVILFARRRKARP